MLETNSVSTAVLRRRCAANFFKSTVLGEKHLPGRHQTQAIINAIPKKIANASIFDRTWKTWFSDGFRTMPHARSVEILDEISNQIVPASSSISKFSWPRHPRFFSELARGGLMSRLLEPTESADRVTTLIGRANHYQPISSLHLHLDALEAAEWFADAGDLPWETIATVAASRILELLHERWGPRHGLLYEEFDSDFSVEWDDADPARRQEIRKSCARFTPDSFNRLMRPGACPDWDLVGCSADTSANHVYKLLFALAADQKFMNERRLPIWSLDLASAALAMHALAWTDRYNTMAFYCPQELKYWCAFEAILFSVEPFDDFEIGAALAVSPARWQEGSFACFDRARESYHSMLFCLNTAATEVLATAMTAREHQRLIYKG